ncbi:hypothetical protein [Rhizobium aouanii]|uniref:Uncharacterized protein n=1 Tax=Rhizobium aouanii TaxID=3118145 RepID=A0ABU8CIG3_9HYPH
MTGQAISATSIVAMSYAEPNRTGGSTTVPVHELPPTLDLAVALVDAALAVGGERGITNPVRATK